VFLGVIGLGILQLFVNTITMVLTFISLIGYAVIYTMYLKTNTIKNNNKAYSIFCVPAIEVQPKIGGAAPAAPPIS
jgi:heme O synthase-like polyprenyltransferase